MSSRAADQNGLRGCPLTRVGSLDARTAKSDCVLIELLIEVASKSVGSGFWENAREMLWCRSSPVRVCSKCKSSIR